jgi:hypothetical protein
VEPVLLLLHVSDTHDKSVDTQVSQLLRSSTFPLQY